MESPTTLRRVPKDMAEKIAAIAWYERKTFAQVIRDLAGEAVLSRFSALPKVARSRAKQSPAASAK